jgi:tetratricopeptide (TPR) repeat protein
MCAKDLRRVSPHNPLAIAAMIDLNWAGDAEKQAERWDQEYAGRPLVMAALARRYESLMRSDDAQRALERYIAKSPDDWAFEKLADYYLAEGDTDKWLATLDEFLKHEDYALAHARVRVKIANHFMEKGEWEQARPYADAAAETYAAWAMLCAARCYEGLGDYQTAEQWVARMAERYDGQQVEWFVWCKRTGHGNVEQAAALAREYFTQLSPRATQEDYNYMGLFNLMNGKELAARDAYQKADKMGHTAYFSVHMALLSDTAGDAEKRDAALKDAIDRPPGKDVVPAFNEASIKLARLFQQSLAGDAAVKLDQLAIDSILKPVNENGAASLIYFAARFLDEHGDKELALSYWRRCAAQKHSLLHVLALDHLRQLGVPPQ